MSVRRPHVDWEANRHIVERVLADGGCAPDVAAAIGCTRDAVYHGLKRLGLKVSRDAISRRISARQTQRWQRDHAGKAEMSERVRQLWADGKMVAGGRWVEHMRWCPPHMRADYAWLRKHKNLTAAERKAALMPEIDAFRRTHEGRLWLLQTGQAEIVGGVFRAK